MSDVELVAIYPNAEKIIIFVARASSDQSNTDEGLIRFLIRNGHWSPFMHAYATLEFNTSRTIAHHMIRHWTIACSYEDDIPAVQEFSQRYAPARGTVKYKGRMKGATNRQSSLDIADDEDQRWFQDAQAHVESLTHHYYTKATERGFALESARFLLLEAEQIKLYLSGSVRSWIHYFGLRCKEDTQLEHRVLVLKAREILAQSLPTVASALDW